MNKKKEKDNNLAVCVTCEMLPWAVSIEIKVEDLRWWVAEQRTSPAGACDEMMGFTGLFYKYRCIFLFVSSTRQPCYYDFLTRKLPDRPLLFSCRFHWRGHTKNWNLFPFGVVAVVAVCLKVHSHANVFLIVIFSVCFSHLSLRAITCFFFPSSSSSVPVVEANRWPSFPFTLTGTRKFRRPKLAGNYRPAPIMFCPRRPTCVNWFACATARRPSLRNANVE